MQPPLADFPGSAYWHELRPLPYFRTIWADVGKVGSTANGDASKTILNALVAAGYPLRLWQYVYLPGAYKTGETNLLPAGAWLDANNGWLYADGEVPVTTTKVTAAASSSSDTVQLVDTTGLTVGMHVWGTGIAESATVQVGSILSSPARITLITDKSTSGPAAYMASVGSGVTLNFSNQIPELRNYTTSRQVSPARVARVVDSNGDNWGAWLGKQIRTDSSYAGWPIYGLAMDNVIPQEGYSIASGDLINASWEGTFHQYGTGHHRLGVRERCTVAAAKAAINTGWNVVFEGLRRSNWRLWANGGTKRPSEWSGQNHSVLMEGWGSYYSDESGSGQAGWRQGLKTATELAAGTTSRSMPVVWHWKIYDDDNAGAGTAARPRNQPLHRDFRFCLATTLLTDSLFAFSLESTEQSGGFDIVWPSEVRYRFYGAEMDAPIGVPVEPPPAHDAGLATGIWTRKYTNGLVIVRPKGTSVTTWGTDASVNFTLPFDCRRLTGTLDPADDGALLPAGTVVSMPPRSGLILLRA